MEYKIQPLDVILFNGIDPVAKFIQSVERKTVVPHLKAPFHALWSHAGLVVTKSILPLDCLEADKLYIFESVFSGEVAGYVYSKVLPVDHPVAKGSFHLGPQIRDFEAVVAEGDSNVGIFPLTSANRSKLHEILHKNPNAILDFYNQYKDHSYPLSILPQLASASEVLYTQLKIMAGVLATHFPHRATAQDHHAVFCSEMVALLYKDLGFESFKDMDAATFTPLELDVAPEFGGIAYYAKENKKQLLKHGKVPTEVLTKVHEMWSNVVHRSKWVAVPPGGPVPEGAEPAGSEADGKSLYIARARIGGALQPGKVHQDNKNASIGFDGSEVAVHYGHEVLVSLHGLQWKEASNGEVPHGAVLAGFEEDGDEIYCARATFASGGVFGITGPLGFGTKKSTHPGKMSKGDPGAKIPYGGKEVIVLKGYEILCHA
ncbi:hypothetical protein HK101_000826 [Irineochytrium annulatum]|nr:hypothetical protein HK101_000826 [Irineochytrium annulatum]